MLQKAPEATHTFQFRRPFVGKCDFRSNVKKDNKRGRMRTACWMAKAKITYSEYLIANSFSVQQWLHECA